MRLEATDADDEYKVWLTDEEIEDLRRATVSYRDDIKYRARVRQSPQHPVK